MVAYSFKARFVDPILAGTKLGTIRAQRKRHAMVGEELQLYRGMRTRSCVLIARGPCIAVKGIGINTGRRPWVRIDGAFVPNLDDFARADGFRDFDDMLAFWAAEHEGPAVFSGVHLLWGPLHGGLKVVA